MLLLKNCDYCATAFCITQPVIKVIRIAFIIFEMVFTLHPHCCGLKCLTKLRTLYKEVLLSSNSTEHHENSILCAEILPESSI